MAKKSLAMILIFIVSSYIFISFSHQFAPSSDSMSGVLEAVDMAAGNWTLKGWYLSTVTFYFTDLIWFAAAIKIFGYADWITYVIPGMMAGSLITACYALSANTDSKWRNIWPLFLFMAVPGGAVSYMFSVAIIHVPTYAYVVFSYILIESYLRSKNVIYLFFSTILSSLTIFSDDITTYIFFIPIALSCIISKGNARERFFIFLSLMLSYALFKILLFISNSSELFFLPGMPSPAFVTYDKLGFNLSLLFKGILTLFNSDFFGKKIASPEGIYSSIKFVVALLFFFFIFRSATKFKSLSLIDIALLISSLIMIPAYAISDKPVDDGTTRYLVPVIIFGSIFICRNLVVSKKTNSLFLLCTIVLSLYSLLFINKPDFKFEFNRSATSHRIISKFLIDNNLHNGYATFWNAASISSESLFNIGPVNIDIGLNRVTPVFWLANSSNFNNGNNFFIIENDDQRNVIESVYGKPESIHRLAGVIVLIYNTNLNVDIGDIYKSADNVLSEFKKDDNSGSICNNGKGGSIAFGPYKDIGRGKYILKVDSSGDDFVVGIYSHLTKERVMPSKSTPENGMYYFNLKNDFPSGEIVITASEGSNTCFKGYEFKRVRK
ncbi:MAG: hypothetical protein KIB03_21960 [Citrobacter freundii]|nr:hypothetical protein [Citrobacter freundii]